MAQAGAALRGGAPGPWHAASLWRARGLAPADAASLLDEAIGWYRSAGRRGSLMAAHTRASEVAQRAGADTQAASHARSALHLAPGHAAPLFYGGEVWLQAARALAAIGDTAGARQAVARGIDVLRATLGHVAPEFQASFVERNPTNAALLALAAGLGLTGAII